MSFNQSDYVSEIAEEYRKNVNRVDAFGTVIEDIEDLPQEEGDYDKEEYEQN